MFGLILVTGLVAVAVVALFTGAFRRPSMPAGPGHAETHQAPDTSLSPPVPAGALGPVPGPQPAPARGPGAEAPAAPSGGLAVLTLDGRLAFAHSPTPDTVVLDCTLERLHDDTDGTVPVGAPFTLQLRLPETAWFATSLELLLEQWAAECRTVEIAITTRDGQAKAHVGDGSSRLMLEVASAAGLSAA